MPVHTHSSNWRGIVAAAPVLMIGLVVAAFIQGEHDIFRSRVVQEILMGLAALGVLVSSWTAWRLGSARVVPAAQARAGPVSLHGKARPLPGAPPLLSPDGLACLWFTHSQRVMHRYDADDSVRPFLLVDDSGSCVVLPAGASIEGNTRSVVTKQAKLSDRTDITGRGTAGYGTGERVLCDGDEIHVSGWFTPASAESLEAQARAAELTGTVEQPRLVLRSNDAAEFEAARAAERSSLFSTPSPELPAAPTPPVPLALPVVGGHGAEPFIINIGRADSDAPIYWLAAIIDALLLLIVAALYLCLQPLSV